MIQPTRFTAVDIDQTRLDHAQRIVESQPHSMEVVLKRTGSAAENDALLSEMGAGSVVINGTGMGKDRPGSPLTEQAIYPKDCAVWEFNYRGPRPFYQHALAQAEAKNLTVVDGWDYFILGWLEVITEAFQVQLTDKLLMQIKAVSG